jgi:hypothetical protein
VGAKLMVYILDPETLKIKLMQFLCKFLYSIQQRSIDEVRIHFTRQLSDPKPDFGEEQGEDSKQDPFNV